MSSSDSSDSEEGAQVRVSLKLASTCTDRSLQVSTAPLAVPADIGRKGLSAVLNHLLGRSAAKDDDSSSSDEDDDGDDSDKASPLNFEFILAGTNNRLLRKGVESEARQHGISLEEAVVITYFPASNVPQLSGQGETMPDWVSCLSAPCDNQSVVVSGCYDGSINVYKRKDSEEATLTKVAFVAAATGPIKAMATANHANQVFVASASLDHTLNLHTYHSDDGLTPYGECIEVESDATTSNACTALDFTAPANSKLILASGDGNGKISLWDVESGALEDHETSEKKKHKTSSSSKSKPSKREIAAMVIMDNAHSQMITGVSWGNHYKNASNAVQQSHLISGSWDHAIKLWDVEKQNCLLTLNGSRVVSCLDTSYHSEGVVATGHPDCTIRLWDVRVNNDKPSAIVADNTFRPSHKAWVTNVHWSQSNAYQLASTSHDGSVKIWDIRSSSPLHTVRAFPKEEKGLCLLWEYGSSSQGEVMFVGGTDCIIKQLKL
jgi:ribosome biogenesis protein YTM1